VKKYCPSKSNAFYLDEQSDQEMEDIQKEVMFTGIEGSNSDDATGQEEFFSSIRCIMSLGVPYLNLK